VFERPLCQWIWKLQKSNFWLRIAWNMNRTNGRHSKLFVFDSKRWNSKSLSGKKHMKAQFSWQMWPPDRNRSLEDKFRSPWNYHGSTLNYWRGEIIISHQDSSMTAAVGHRLECSGSDLRSTDFLTPNLCEKSRLFIPVWKK
jgi:hypothetical protein